MRLQRLLVRFVSMLQRLSRMFVARLMILFTMMLGSLTMRVRGKVMHFRCYFV
jgi:hypothetical protein